MPTFNPLIRDLGIQEYEPTWRAMQAFTQQRITQPASVLPDELWCLQHPPVYTLGLNGKKQHILQTNSIPLIEVDRGGQVTYHGPGQLIIYLLIDLKQRHYGVHELVHRIEQAIIQLLAAHAIEANGRENAPGVYVNDKKIAALGLRVKKNFVYHGLALNVAMDLSPFNAINPCGYQGLAVTDMASLNIKTSVPEIQRQLVNQLQNTL